MGRQIFGAISNFIGYYVIGIPLGCFFVFWFFKGNDIWAARGIWIGMIVGLSFVGVVSAIAIVFATDWQKQSKLAQERHKVEENKAIGEAAANGGAEEELEEVAKNSEPSQHIEPSDEFEVTIEAKPLASNNDEEPLVQENFNTKA